MDDRIREALKHVQEAATALDGHADLIDTLRALRRVETAVEAATAELMHAYVESVRTR